MNTPAAGPARVSAAAGRRAAHRRPAPRPARRVRPKKAQETNDHAEVAVPAVKVPRWPAWQVSSRCQRRGPVKGRRSGLPGLLANGAPPAPEARTRPCTPGLGRRKRSPSGTRVAHLVLIPAGETVRRTGPAPRTKPETGRAGRRTASRRGLLPPGLPDPLRRFHAVAGRRPSPHPDGPQPFYAGQAGRHLLPPQEITALPDGRLVFFREYQGDCDGLTLPGQADPPVWQRRGFPVVSARTVRPLLTGRGGRSRGRFP